jgi:hypothetical protein
MSADSPSPTRELNQYFLLKVAETGRGAAYVVCEPILAVDECALPEGVRSAIDAEFEAARGRVLACEIPDPDDCECSWSLLQAKYLQGQAKTKNPPPEE